jgi:hypothetical protein
MYRATGKFVAVLLAIWLPLFSGNALAMSVAMQRGGSHPVAAQQEAHCDPVMQQHAYHDAADQNQSVGQEHSDGGDCGICHLACCGYLATALVKVADARPPALRFLPVLTYFHSFTTAPLDPPPLARA